MSGELNSTIKESRIGERRCQCMGSLSHITTAAKHGLEALYALLPLFYEKSVIYTMIKHGMDVQRQAIQFLNTGQIPSTTFDQLLFALAKLAEWQFPATHREVKYLVMLGGLHTEIVL